MRRRLADAAHVVDQGGFEPRVPPWPPPRPQAGRRDPPPHPATRTLVDHRRKVHRPGQGGHAQKLAIEIGQAMTRPGRNMQQKDDSDFFERSEWINARWPNARGYW